MIESTPAQVEVDVQIGGVDVLAGRAWFQPGRATQPMTFAYDPAFVARPDAYALDPGLPLDTAQQHTAGMFGAFADAAPDRWGRRLVERGHREAGGGRQTLAEADYLLRISDELRHGAIRFRPAGSPTYLARGARIPPVIDLPVLAGAVAAAEADPHESVKLLLDAGTSTLGGARPKATVTDGGRWYLAKFSRVGDEWDVIALEKTALDIADRAGVTVPRRRLAMLPGGPTLLVERFDRRGGQRIGYLSAMSLLQRRDGDPSPADYLDIAEHLEVESTDPVADLRQLWLRVAVSVAVNNTDDHLRNHGFLRADSWRLSPAFDVNPNPNGAQPRCTAIGGASPDEEIQALLEHAPLFRLTRDEARNELRRLANAVGAWRELAALNHVTGASVTILGDAIAVHACALADATS